MANQENNCYLGIDGKKSGPLSELDIQKMYDAGEITGNTKFIHAGMKEWINLSESGIIIPHLPDDNDGLPALPNDVESSSQPTIEDERVLSNIKKFADSKECKCLECGYNGFMGIIRSQRSPTSALKITIAFAIIAFPVGYYAFIAILTFVLNSMGIGHDEAMNTFWAVLIAMGIIGFCINPLYPSLWAKKVLFCPNCENEIIER